MNIIEIKQSEIILILNFLINSWLLLGATEEFILFLCKSILL